MIQTERPSHESEPDTWGADVFDATWRDPASIPRDGYRWGGMTMPPQDHDSFHCLCLTPEQAKRSEAAALAQATKRAQGLGGNGRPVRTTPCVSCGAPEIHGANRCRACYRREVHRARRPAAAPAEAP